MHQSIARAKIWFYCEQMFSLIQSERSDEWRKGKDKKETFSHWFFLILILITSFLIISSSYSLYLMFGDMLTWAGDLETQVYQIKDLRPGNPEDSFEWDDDVCGIFLFPNLFLYLRYHRESACCSLWLISRIRQGQWSDVERRT